MLKQILIDKLNYITLSTDQIESSTSPTPDKPRPFDYSRGGEFDLCLGGVGKIGPEVSGFKFFFSSAWIWNTFIWVLRISQLNEQNW